MWVPGAADGGPGGVPGSRTVGSVCVAPVPSLGLKVLTPPRSPAGGTPPSRPVYAGRGGGDRC